MNAEPDISAQIPVAEEETSPPLGYVVAQAVHAYFDALEDHEPAALYRLVMNEVERPLLETVLHRARGNQCRAAAWLGISRGTLRKKLAAHGLL